MIDLTKIDINPIPEPIKVLIDDNTRLGNKNLKHQITIGILIGIILITLPYLTNKNNYKDENQ